AGRLDTHQGDLEATGGAVERALQGTDWGVHVVGTGLGVQAALGLSEAPSTTEGWVSYQAYPEKLAELGVGIVPLADSPFNQSKSSLKLIEMSACGVPTVASPSPDNERVHAMGVGLLARSPQQWQKKLRALIHSKDLRAEVVGRSREALATQTYEHRAGDWLDAWLPDQRRHRTRARSKVFLGIITCERPNYLSITLDGYKDHIAQLTDELMIVHDGIPSEATAEACGDLIGALRQTGTSRRGVAAAKNLALQAGLDANADWIFLLEDDVVPQSPRAIAGYVEAAQASGYGHLSFHAHGPLNTHPCGVEGPVTLWQWSVGAFCLYSRAAIEKGGLFDEGFVNAWDHVEHSLRLAHLGFAPT
ncbi:MAG: glycosyltransferase, partial [Cyanobacteria bacterium REEB65]|nr:glycosyltransferase [Cyanobacteria bacterium REEB65]